MNRQPVWWLVRHTENKPSATFPLFKGTNFIGRAPVPSMPFYTLIDEDPYISRIHAVIYVENIDTLHLYICDSDLDNGGKASKNGTYINGHNSRIVKKIKIKENDTIQVGITKLVLKYNAGNLEEIVNEVEQQNYVDTISMMLEK